MKYYRNLAVASLLLAFTAAAQEQEKDLVVSGKEILDAPS